MPEYLFSLTRIFPVDTRRRLNGNATLHDIVKRRIDVKTMLCVYRVPV